MFTSTSNYPHAQPSKSVDRHAGLSELRQPFLYEYYCRIAPASPARKGAPLLASGGKILRALAAFVRVRLNLRPAA